MSPKLSGMEFYEKTLGSPKLVVAPMVDASELAWRMLSRRHGAQLCYTPMFHSSVFCRDPKYRKEALQTCEEDRPLIVQFCGNDAQIMLKAAQFAEEHCDAIDINLGCPQAIARRGHYGSFLQDEWELLTEIVSTLNKSLSVPVTCKVRVYEDVEKTIKYAQMLEAAGCQMLTVHGRTRDQKGPLTGLASWDHIKAVRENVKIPVFANGNIQYAHDVENCIDFTGVQGVMSAEGNLYNPSLFEGISPPTWEVAAEYLELVEQYPCPSSYIRGHLFKIFQHLMCLKENAVQRSALAVAQNCDDYRKVVNEIKQRYEPYHEGIELWISETVDESYDLILPPWLCQPYVRLPPEEHIRKVEEHEAAAKENEGTKRQYEDNDGNAISRKRMKKLRRIQRRPVRDPSHYVKRSGEKCLSCPNPIGDKCKYTLCKKCCKDKCFHENLDCEGHRILVKTRRQMAMEYAAERQNGHNEAIEDNDKNMQIDYHKESVELVSSL